MFRFSIKRAAACGAVLVATSAMHAQSALAAVDEIRVKVGLAFPSITLPLLKDGSPASIADFRGEKIIMHVFASW